MFAEGQVIGSAKVYGGAEGNVPLVAGREVRVMMPKSGGDRLIARIVYNGPVPAPVEQGAPIGMLKVWRNDNVILQMPLKAAEPVAQGRPVEARFRCRLRIDDRTVPRRRAKAMMTLTVIPGI